MKKLLSISLFCGFTIIGVFLLFGEMEDWAQGRLASSPSVLSYCLVSGGLLISDIILPVPSSLIMILNGKILGVWGGASLSVVTGTASSLIGFYLGRKANPVLDRWFSPRDRALGDRLFSRYGHLTIAVSKAVPILSEVISIVSGTSPLSLRKFFLYSVIGHFLVSVIYALAGNYAANPNAAWISGVVIVSIMVAGWLAQFLVRNKPPGEKALTVVQRDSRPRGHR